MYSGTSPSCRSRRTATFCFKFSGCFESKGRSCSNRAYSHHATSFYPADGLDPQLAHINTKTLQIIGDQQFQILTALIPVLPMLQKVPLHIASTEANLKEAIRKSIVAPPSTRTQPTSAGSTSGSVKRKSSRNAEQCSPSPSVTKRRRIQIDSGYTAQQQLPSPKFSHDSLLTQSGLPAVNQHRPIGAALRSGSRSASRSSNQPPNPGQRSFMQPPTPKIVPSPPSRMHSITLSDRSAQPTPSSHSHKKQRALDASVLPHFTRPAPNAQSVTPAPLNHLDHPNDAFKAPNPFYIHTPLRTGSKQLGDWSSRPSAPVQSSSGLSAVRRQLTREPLLSHAYHILFFFSPSHSDEGNASSRLPMMTMTRLSMIDVQQTTKSTVPLLFQLPQITPRVRFAVFLLHSLAFHSRPIVWFSHRNVFTACCVLQINPDQDALYRRFFEWVFKVQTAIFTAWRSFTFSGGSACPLEVTTSRSIQL